MGCRGCNSSVLRDSGQKPTAARSEHSFFWKDKCGQRGWKCRRWRVKEYLSWLSISPGRSKWPMLMECDRFLQIEYYTCHEIFLSRHCGIFVVVVDISDRHHPAHLCYWLALLKVGRSWFWMFESLLPPAVQNDSAISSRGPTLCGCCRVSPGHCPFLGPAECGFLCPFLLWF